MTKTWILVANASRARCFERDALSAPLNELADFVFPHTRLGGEATGDRSTDPPAATGDHRHLPG